MAKTLAGAIYKGFKLGTLTTQCFAPATGYILFRTGLIAGLLLMV